MDSLIFDLDGTLWDTCSACAVAWNIVLKRHHIPFREITAEDVRSVTGKTHENCIREVFKGLPESQIITLIEETQNEDNQVIARLGGKLYSGVAEGLATLSRRYPLFIVSNCQRGYIETFLELNGFAGLFRDFECWGNTGRPKPDNLRSVIVRNELSSPLFIGDAEGDEQAALACDVPFAYASYGFGRCSRYSISVANFSDLVEWVNGT